MPKKSDIGEAVSDARAKKKQAIDTVLDTLYHLHVAGSVEDKVEKAALERLKRIFSKLDKDQERLIEQTEQRLRTYYSFRDLSKEEQDSIIQRARETHLEIEEAVARMPE